jgi:hypothetical protein
MCVYRAPTTLKSEGEVTSLSGADKREVRDNREKWSILFIYYLLDNKKICAFIICARQNKKYEKGLLNTKKQKTNTRTYVNQSLIDIN